MTGEAPGMTVHAVGMQEAVSLILDWATRPEGRMVCAADVHMAMRHHDEPDFREAMAQADLVTPDGMPVVWLLRRQGHSSQARVCGPDLTLELCAAAADKGFPVGFFGGRPEVLESLVARLKVRHPALQVAYACSPPFRAMSEAEDLAEMEAIRKAGVRLLFVGLGCPKQERWMAAHKGRVEAVMLGVGAAFDFHAGSARRAPRWMQRTGLEWAFRAMEQPGRIIPRLMRFHGRFVWHSVFGKKLIRGTDPLKG